MRSYRRIEKMMNKNPLCPCSLLQRFENLFLGEEKPGFTCKNNIIVVISKVLSSC